MKFFFHIQSHKGREVDHDGTELPSLDAARNAARTATKEMVAEMILHEERIDGTTFEIADGAGTILATVPFRELIRLK